MQRIGLKYGGSKITCSKDNVKFEFSTEKEYKLTAALIRFELKR